MGMNKHTHKQKYDFSLNWPELMLFLDFLNHVGYTLNIMLEFMCTSKCKPK